MEVQEPEPGNGLKYLQQYGLAHDGITSLNLFLDGVQLGPEGALQVSRGLTENWSLTSLELRRNDLTHQGAIPLAQALVTNRSLTYLGLGRNKLSNSGGLHIAEALRYNQTLRSIDLEWNDLRDESGVALAEMLTTNNSLIELSVERNKIQRDGIASIGGALAHNKKLKLLNLGWNRAKIVGAIAIADGLRQNQHLLSLNMAMNQIGQEGAFAIANALSENYTLISLNLQHNRIGDSLIMLGEALKGNHTLRELNMEGCSLTSELAVLFGKALVENASLMSLNISRNDIRDAGVISVASAFKSKHSIRFVDFSETGATHISMPAVSDLLDACVNFQTLLLEDNNIGSEGIKIIATKLKALTPLTSLNLSRTRLEAKGVKILADALKSSTVKYMRTLQLADNDAGSESALQLCKALTHGSCLLSLDLSTNDISDIVKEAICQVLVANPSLPYVFLKGNPLAMNSDNNSTAIFKEEAQPFLTGVLGMHWCPPKTGEEAAVTGEAEIYAPSGNFASKNIMTGSVRESAKSIAELTSPNGDASPAVVSIRGDRVLTPGDGSANVNDDIVGAAASLRNLEAFAAENNKDLEQRNVEVDVARRTQVPVKLVSTLRHSRLVQKPYKCQTHRLENNMNELLLTDDQLRKEFNNLDTDGNGFLNKTEFKKIYRSFNNFGVVPSDREIDGILKKHNTRGDERIMYNEYCVIMLGIARR